MFRRSVHIPEDVDWSQRAHPSAAAEREDLAMNALMVGAHLDRAKRIARENKAWLKRKASEQSGRLVGYHGTSSAAAAGIATRGFINRVNEEGRRGVSAWDEVAAKHAGDFARDRSRQEGEVDGGVVFEIAMTDPKPDRHGRLEWLADAGKVEILRSWPAAEFVADPEAAIRASAGAVALSHEIQ